MKDKVSELRCILSQRKAAEEKMAQQATTPTQTKTAPSAPTAAHPNETKQLPAADTVALEKKITELENKIWEMEKEHKTQREFFLRKAADLENSKKRLEKEYAEQAQFAAEKIITDILPIIDNLEMTLAHAQENDPIGNGVKLIYKNLLQSLEKFGVKPITGEGKIFDPHQQEAIGTEAHKELPPGTVVSVHRKGYLLHDKVIRAALVTVCKN